MTSLVSRERGEQVPQPVARDVSGTRGLLDRKDLLRLLDRAVTRRLTVISAPPGSGKTSLVRAWAEHSRKFRRVAFVSVEPGQQNEQRFWWAVLGAVRDLTRSTTGETSPAASALPDVEQIVDSVLSEIAEHAEPVVLIIDDLHELRSSEALTQLEYFLATLPDTARLVLSSRRDPSIRLHQLRLADAIAEIRAGDLRFTEGETRELLAGSAISLSGEGVAALHQRTEGWGGRLAPGGDLAHRSPGARAFRGRVLGD
jgi:LuxR family maltose regulon positive regulatory protein